MQSLKCIMDGETCVHSAHCIGYAVVRIMHSADCILYRLQCIVYMERPIVIGVKCTV